MKSCLFLLILFAPATGIGQVDLSNCPKIYITGPPGIWRPGDELSYSAQIESKKPLPAALKYSWSVSNGQLIRGNGSRQVVVVQRNGDPSSLTVTVKVGGLPQGCPATASERSAITIDPESILFDESGTYISLSGTVYDQNGALVVGGQIKLVSAGKKSVLLTTSYNDGTYSIAAPHGRYDIQVSADGFETKIFPGFDIVDMRPRKMCFDIVLLGSTAHEPCGYGGDCPGAGLKVIEEQIPVGVSDKITYRKPVTDSPRNIPRPR